MSKQYQLSKISHGNSDLKKKLIIKGNTFNTQWRYKQFRINPEELPQKKKLPHFAPLERIE